MSAHVPFNALKTFESVVRLESFTRAAEELHVTQSAISHQIKLLEDWVGKPLFDRSRGHRPKLLPEARWLAGVLSVAFDDIKSACRKVRNTKESSSIVIAAIPSIATCWLIPRLAEFRAAHPDIGIRMMYAIHGQRIGLDDSDISIVYSAHPLSVSTGSAKRLLAGDSAPICSRTFLELHKPLFLPEEILKAALIHDTNMSGWSEWFLKVLGCRIVPSDGPVFEDFNLLRAATLAGQGISLCPLSIIEDDLESGRLIQLSDKTILHESAYYVVRPGHARTGFRAEVELFNSWLFDQASSRRL